MSNEIPDTSDTPIDTPEQTENVGTIVNNPDTLDSDSCDLQQTTDEQLNQNLASLVELLVSSLQDGTIPVLNTSRLQNLTINDIIQLTIDKIDIPNITNHIVTNENNEITNVIESITNYDMVTTDRFVYSDFIKFEVFDKNITDSVGVVTTKKYISAHLPADILNKDKIVSIYITTKDDENDNVIDNHILFDYQIDIDTNDAFGRYKIEVLAEKITIGKTITNNIDTLPVNPELWGTFSDERYIKVSHLVDANWVAATEEAEEEPGFYNVIKSSPVQNIIPMNFGNMQNTVPNESINMLHEPELIMVQEDTELLTLEKKTKVQNEPRLLIESDIVSRIVHPDLINFINTPDMISLQLESDTIVNIIDNIHDFQILHKETNSAEMVNVFVMPPNKIVSQIITDNFDIPKPIIKGTANHLIIEQMLTDLIETNIVSELPEYLENESSELNMILKLATGTNNTEVFVQKIFVTDYIIEQLIAQICDTNTHFNVLHEFDNVISFYGLLAITLDMVNLIKSPTRIIEFKKLIIQTYIKSYNYINEALLIIEQNNTELVAHRERVNLLLLPELIIEQIGIDTIDTTKKEYILNEPNNLIEQDQIDALISKNYTNLLNDIKLIILNIKTNLVSHRERVNFLKIPELLIEQDTTAGLLLLGEVTVTQRVDGVKTQVKQYDNLRVNEFERIINQVAVAPASMVISSGSVAFLRDLQSLKVVSSLSLENDFVSMYQAEGQQQRSVYEIKAEQDQRVFRIKTNPADTTVYREGFRLSRGDYYVNANKIILKVGANLGETITIVSEKKYSYSDTITRNELENAISTLKAERPIISYAASTYELSTLPIIIENFDITTDYKISVKFDGKERNDIAFIRNRDTIYLDIPEIINVRRKLIQITIQSVESGKIQSLPTTAEIQIKNLYDYDINDEPNRLVIGTTPDEWYYKDVTNLSFVDTTVNSTYTLVPDTNYINIEKDDYIQSNVIKDSTFSGTFIETYLGLENLDTRRIGILSSTVSETILNLTLTPEQLEDAFNNDRLWFILDASTGDSTNSDYLNAVNGLNIGTTQKYAYRNARELMNSLNILPRTTDTIYMEHIDKIKNRIVKDIIIFDVDMKVDYDFEDFAIIPENDMIIKNDIIMESIEYNVHDEIPHLLIKINNPLIPTVNNPYINLSSKLYINTDNVIINGKQDTGLPINNFYSEAVFSGLITDHTSTNQNEVLDLFRGIKKFDFDLFDTQFKKDYFVITEEALGNPDPSGFTEQNEVYLGMVRFKSDEEVIKDNIIPETRLKAFGKILAKEKAFRVLSKTETKIPNVGSEFVSDFALIEYGGYSIVTDNENVPRKIIDSDIVYRQVYLQDKFNIDNGIVTTNTTPDAFNYRYDTHKTIHISSYWDLIYKPSTRSAKSAELRAIWTLIRDNVQIDDQRWMNLTDGLLEKGGYAINDDQELITRDSEVQNIPLHNGFLLFGGNGFDTTLKQVYASTVTARSLAVKTENEEEIAPILTAAYNKRFIPLGYEIIDEVSQSNDGWLRRQDILDIRYGWENNQPYVEYHWAKTYEVVVSRDQETGEVTSTTEGMSYYVHRVSKTPVQNKDIYYISTDAMNDYVYDATTPSHGNTIKRKLTIPNYQKLFDSDVSNPIFHDIIYENETWWMIITPSGETDKKLYKLYMDNIPTEASSFIFEEMYTLGTKKWTLTNDVSGTVRGDGPILMKHLSIIENDTNGNDSGIYYFDTWDNTLQNKTDTKITMDAELFSIPSINGIRNPYYIGIGKTPELNYRIDIVGTRIYAVVYLDKFISTLTLDEFNLFKEEIVHINEGASVLNPTKIVSVLPNDIKLTVKAIIPDEDSYKADSAQIIFNREATPTGRIASNLVYRLTNPIDIPLSIDSIRFVTK